MEQRIEQLIEVLTGMTVDEYAQKILDDWREKEWEAEKESA